MERRRQARRGTSTERGLFRKRRMLRMLKRMRRGEWCPSVARRSAIACWRDTERSWRSKVASE
jgi:hypothetical protein